MDSWLLKRNRGLKTIPTKKAQANNEKTAAWTVLLFLL